MHFAVTQFSICLISPFIDSSRLNMDLMFCNCPTQMLGLELQPIFFYPYIYFRIRFLQYRVYFILVLLAFIFIWALISFYWNGDQKFTFGRRCFFMLYLSIHF